MRTAAFAHCAPATIRLRTFAGDLQLPAGIAVGGNAVYVSQLGRDNVVWAQAFIGQGTTLGDQNQVIKDFIADSDGDVGRIEAYDRGDNLLAVYETSSLATGQDSRT